MIAFPQRLPNVIWKDSRLVPLSEGWVAECIEASAQRAGAPNWELTPHIAHAIVQFLEEECDEGSMTVADLETVIERSLTGIGFEDIAAQSHLTAPRVNIHLPELACQTRYELMFFPELGSRLEDAVAVEVTGIRLLGLKDCAKILYNAKRWQSKTQQLSNQIATFSRDILVKADVDSMDLHIVP